MQDEFGGAQQNTSLIFYLPHVKPKVSAELMIFWLHRFRKPDVRQQSHRKMLIDTFINAIFLYDDKMVITFNYKEGTKTTTLAELQEAISNKNGSDLDCLAAPKHKKSRSHFGRELFMPFVLSPLLLMRAAALYSLIYTHAYVSYIT